MLAYESDTAWNSSCIFLVSYYIVLLNASKRLSKVISFEIQWICWPMRQIQTETGKSLAIFQNTNPIVLVMFISLFFDLLNQRRYRRKSLWRLNEKCVGIWGRYSLKQGNPLKKIQNTDKMLLLKNLFFNYCIIKGIKVKKFWRWIEKVLDYVIYFLAWICEKKGLNFFFW